MNVNEVLMVQQLGWEFHGASIFSLTFLICVFRPEGRELSREVFFSGRRFCHGGLCRWPPKCLDVRSPFGV